MRLTFDSSARRRLQRALLLLAVLVLAALAATHWAALTAPVQQHIDTYVPPGHPHR